MRVGAFFKVLIANELSECGTEFFSMFQVTLPSQDPSELFLHIAFDLHPVCFRAFTEVKFVHFQQLTQAWHWVWVIVHPIIKPAVKVPTVPCFGLDHIDRGGLASALIAAGALASQ